jgi:hypothetical protein
MIPIKLIPLLSFVVVGIQASPLHHEARADGVVSSATLDGVTYLNKVSWLHTFSLNMHLSALVRALLGLDSFLPTSRTRQVIPWAGLAARWLSKENLGRKKMENSPEFSMLIQIAVTTRLSLLSLSICAYFKP